MKKTILPLIVLGLAITLHSCKKDKNEDYNVPTTYNFSNADYSGSTKRLAMIEELVDAVKAGSSGAVLNATQLKNMYSNTGNPFSDNTLNISGVQLKDKTYVTDQAMVETWIDNAATASQNPASAGNGNEGIVTNGTKSYLVDAGGFDYKEGVEKHLQGALLYYQITAVCLSDNQVGSSVTLAERQKHWDEAFGYFGVPVDYPTNTNGLLHLGEYFNDRAALLGNASTLMTAFLKGRAAINNDDNETVNAQIAIIRDNLEKGVAATAVHYINSGLASIGDNAVRSHTLSESYFLIKSLQYNPTGKATSTQIATLLGYFGGNLWTVSTTDLQAAKNLLSTIYGFDTIKDQL